MTSPEQTTSDSGIMQFYKAQMLQIVFSVVITVLNTYVQVLINNVISSIQALAHNVQKGYMTDAQTLYDLSFKYATGIIGVDSETFLVNLALPLKIDSAKVAQSEIQTSPNEISSCLMSYSGTFTNKTVSNKICIITILDQTISVKVPNCNQSLSVGSYNSVGSSGNFAILAQNPYVYVIDKSNQKTYVFKHVNKVVTWFFYKDERSGLSLEMTPSNIIVGCEKFAIDADANWSAKVSARARHEEDPLKVSY